MKTRHTPAWGTLLVVAAAVALAVGGCSRDGGPATSGSAATDAFDGIDLARDFGGLTATAEDPAFADPGMEAALAAEAGEACDDPLLASPEFVRLDRMAREHPDLPDSLRPGLTFLRLRWGRLAGPADSLDASGACARTDWSGTITVDRGLLVVRRVLAFEWPNDQVVFPRVDAQTVSLVSATRCGHDGIVLQVVTRPAALEDSTASGVPNRVRVALGPFSGTWDLAALAAVDTVISVDADGNAFEVSGVRPVRPDACPSGTLAGRYHPAATDLPDSVAAGDPRRLGRFMVACRAHDGRIAGFVRGAYGVDGDGIQVFVGKFIGRRGEFRGLVRGTWEAGDVAGGLGHFNGQWFGAGGAAEGVVSGDGHARPEGDGGHVTGRWAALCDGQVADTVR